MKRRMNRRKFLGYSAAATGVIVVGGAAAVFNGNHSYIRDLLGRMVGTFEMDADQLDQFVRSVEKRYEAEKLMALIGLSRLRSGTGLGTSYTDPGVDRFERMLLTDFMVATDFLRKRNEDSPRVSYIGHFPCNNPYARFA